MDTLKIDQFTVDVFLEGFPELVDIQHRTGKMRINVHELAHLRYALRDASKKIKAKRKVKGG